jgi:hypothetical protein
VALGNQLLAVMDDYDLLLSSDTNFMLGRWLEWAKDWSEIPANKAQLEFNARNILTWWGPSGQINDYAKKEWGGLVRDYYKQRWAIFIDMATTCLKNGTPWSQSAYSTRMLVHFCCVEARLFVGKVKPLAHTRTCDLGNQPSKFATLASRILRPWQPTVRVGDLGNQTSKFATLAAKRPSLQPWQPSSSLRPWQ